MKSVSEQSPEGRIFNRFHLAATSSSILEKAGGSVQTKPVRSPMTVSVVDVVAPFKPHEDRCFATTHCGQQSSPAGERDL